VIRKKAEDIALTGATIISKEEGGKLEDAETVLGFLSERYLNKLTICWD
jgi:hypothetical protein